MTGAGRDRLNRPLAHKTTANLDLLGIDTKALISYKCHAVGFCHLTAVE